MKDHFTKAIKARDALLVGDMVALKEPTTWLAEHEVDANIPDAWKPFIGDMQNAAKLGGQATGGLLSPSSISGWSGASPRAPIPASQATSEGPMSPSQRRSAAH